MKTAQEELDQHAKIQQKMLDIGRKLMQSKRELQAEIREDAKKPEFRAAIERLKANFN
jgi:hypothetical protein